PPPYIGVLQPPHATVVTSPPAISTCTSCIRPPRFDLKATVPEVDTPKTLRGPQSDVLHLRRAKLSSAAPARACPRQAVATTSGSGRKTSRGQAKKGRRTGTYGES